jgi:phage baseplate assembly protein W
MSRIDKYTSGTKKTELYSDFFNNLTPHPDSKQLVRKTNEDAVKQAIRNLIQTNDYERPFQPTIRSNVRKILFELISPQTTEMLKTYVTEVIENHEPRAKLINVIVTPDEFQQAYFITILFYVINTPDPIELTVTLYRVR